MRFHREMLARDFVATGLSPSEAHDAARRQFGNSLLFRERSADATSFRVLDDLVQDVRFGLRLLRRSPLFTIVSVVAIGVAIGINSGFFTLIDAFVWRPIPVPRSDGLVRMSMTLSKGGSGILFSYPQVQAIAQHSRTLSDVLPLGRCAQVAFRSSTSATAEPATAVCVSGNFFESLGGVASLGRALVPGDERDDAPPAIAISDRFWTSAFSRDPNVVGRDVIINGMHATVTGVIAPGFVGLVPLIPDFWITIPAASRIGATPGRLDDPANQFIDLKAKLRPGIALEQAAAEISGIAVATDVAVRLDGSRVNGVRLQPNQSMLPATWSTMLIVAPALTIVALVLVIACANLANLLLSRSLARQREIAARLALGASRARLVRQLLTESLVIALLGAALGFLLSTWTVTVVSRSYFSNLPAAYGAIAIDLQPSWRVVAYTIGLGVISVLAFGLAPALQATATNLTASLKGDDGMFGSRIRRSRLRDVLISVEVAGSLVLLVAAATLLVSIRSFGARFTGFDPRRVSVATLGLAAVGRVPPALDSARATLMSRATRLEGVDGTARALHAPYTSWWPLLTVSATGRTYLRVQYNAITPRYFDVFGQRIVTGRAFTTADSAAESRVAIVTTAAARALWPTSPAVGQTLRVAERADDPDVLYRVVGVAADAHAGMIWDNDDDGYVFLPATSKHFATYEMPLLARSDTPQPVLARALQNIARQVDANSPIHVEPAIIQRELMMTPIRYGSWITSGVGAFGLGLALIGLYGVVSFAVGQRRHEIAVHVAMGAASSDVLRLILRREMRLVLVGLAAGLALASLEAKLIQVLIVPLTPLSVGGFATLTALLLTTAGVATIVPALGALRIAPMQVLRQD
jgi:predicted permease